MEEEGGDGRGVLGGGGGGVGTLNEPGERKLWRLASGKGCRLSRFAAC